MLYNDNYIKEKDIVPPKAKITKDMVVDAAFEVARKAGAENINARTVSNELN